MGVAPAEDGEFRTRPPGPFGGNMDVRELCTGATLYLPVLALALYFLPEMHTRPRETAKSALTASSVPRKYLCVSVCTGSNRSPDR